MSAEKTTAIRLNARTPKRVDGIARAMSFNQAIQGYLDYEEWFLGAVKRGLKEARWGELLEHQAVVSGWLSNREAKVDARR